MQEKRTNNTFARRENSKQFCRTALSLIICALISAVAVGAPPAVQTKPSEKAPKPKVIIRSEAEINALIRTAGQTRPGWWEATPLEYPPTLDLEGNKKVQGWQPNVKLGAHMISIINPNPDRWKKGIRLLHHVLTVRKDNPKTLREAIDQLATSYRRLLKDYARAAFWYRKSLNMSRRAGIHAVVGLAECYWKLGNRPMASGLLSRYRLHKTPNAGAIRLWSDMGRHRLALNLAVGMTRGRRKISGYLAAGDVCYAMGKYEKAIEHYQKVVELTDNDPRARQRAETNIETIRLFETVDPARIPDGTYSDTSVSFRGDLTVEVVVKSGRIESVKVTQQRDDMFLTALSDIPEQIVAKQSIKGIDSVSGATVTSRAIVYAVAEALAGAAKQQPSAGR